MRSELRTVRCAAYRSTGMVTSPKLSVPDQNACAPRPSPSSVASFVVSDSGGFAAAMLRLLSSGEAVCERVYQARLGRLLGARLVQLRTLAGCLFVHQLEHALTVGVVKSRRVEGLHVRL